MSDNNATPKTVADAPKPLWAGRFSAAPTGELERFGASLPFDKRMWRQDIRGSKAHAAMLAHQGVISQQEAWDAGMVGPFARASNVNNDVRCLRNGGYQYLQDFQPILDTDGDCYARVKVRALEVLQSIDIINEMIDTIPAGDIAVKVKGNPTAGAEACNVLEQPRGECYYYARGNGTKYLERMRMRTPTSQNLAGMTLALKGCDLADVNNIVLTIDPCISCTER